MAASQDSNENSECKNHEDDGEIPDNFATSAASQQRNNNGSKSDLNRNQVNPAVTINIGTEACCQEVEQKRLNYVRVQADEVRHFQSQFEDVLQVTGSLTATDNLRAPLQETMEGGKPSQLVLTAKKQTNWLAM